MIIPQYIKDSLKNTLGYAEAESKESYTVGSNTAFIKAEEYYNGKISQLERQVDMYKSAYENTLEEIKSISNIISKYSEI